MNLMYAAIGLGVVLISIGLVMNVINRFRRGDTLGALLDKFGLTGLVFYWGALGILLGGTAIRSRALFAVLIMCLLGLPIIGWILKGPLEYLHHSAMNNEKRSTGNIVMAILESCIEAFEGLLSYLANTISFVRLTAYSMSHAALLVAAFMVAEEVKHISFGGTFLSITVVILGNIVAIVLEGIIASVQALRLEYYEFFGKFFSGDGKAFEPFRLHQR
jgi:V/A-type H+-transporting ATPase subunit I